MQLQMPFLLRLNLLSPKTSCTNFIIYSTFLCISVCVFVCMGTREKCTYNFGKLLIKQIKALFFFHQNLRYFLSAFYCLLETVLSLTLPTMDFANFVAYVDCFAIYTSV